MMEMAGHEHQDQDRLRQMEDFSLIAWDQRSCCDFLADLAIGRLDHEDDVGHGDAVGAAMVNGSDSTCASGDGVVGYQMEAFETAFNGDIVLPARRPC